MKSCSFLGILLAALAALLLVFSAAYTVGEQEQVIITRFGKPIGAALVEPGLHFKVPFVDVANRFEKRVLEWDGPPLRITTRDKKYIMVDTFGRWRITDPLMFLQQLTDERRALSRLDDILASETPNVIAKHDFIEVVRTSKDRKAVKDESIAAASVDARIGVLPAIIRGRSLLEEDIFKNAAPKVKGLGIELLDVRFKRINYNEGVRETIYQRMISERLQIAERFRSEGAGEAAKIDGNRERELNRIESEAYRKVQEVEGAADAKATEIYAKAYNQNAEALALFEFQRSMDAYKKVLTADTTLILTTNNEFLRYLKSSEPAKASPKPLSGPADLSKGLQGVVNGLPPLLETSPAGAQAR